MKKETGKPILNLRPIRIDFRKSSIYYWIFRRSIISLLLLISYVYAISFTIMVVMSTKPTLAVGVLSSIILLLDIPIILMSTFGFLGSVFYITWVFVSTENKIDFPISWYITRPLQGVLMAIFIYYAFRAGQIIFYSGKGDVNADEINIYTLSILAIVTGMFTEKAYNKISSIADKIFKRN